MSRRFLAALPFFLLGCADRDKSQHVEWAVRNGEPLLGQAIYPPSDAPKKPGLPPCAVLLHGGGWNRGRREDMGAFARRLASHGIVCFSVDYRLAPTHRWPAPFVDARDAVRWVRANAATLGVDPRRVVAVGVSAGAQLALSLSARGECPAGSVFGPVDLGPGEMPKNVEDLRGLLLDDPVLTKDASPLRWVGARSAPAFLIQGGKDETVPPAHGVRFASAMRTAGRPVELVVLKDAPHLVDSYSFDVWAAVDRMAVWILALES